MFITNSQQSPNPAHQSKPILIPRLSHKANSGINFVNNNGSQHQHEHHQVYNKTRIQQKLTQSQRIQLSYHRKFNNSSNNKPIYQCKQNLSPTILELDLNLEQKQKKLENMYERMYMTQPKRPISSFELSHQVNTVSQPVKHHGQNMKKVSQFDIGRSSKMQSVCSKMTQSIILSSDTLDSMTEMSAPLAIDQFQKIKFLGQGKFGQVHLVKHKNTGFTCALKIITKSIVREQKTQAQIAKQLRIHNKLRSLNIIDFYGFFDDEKYFYILLEYASEGSVFSKLKGRNRFQESQILPIAKGLCDGLRFMHRMGYIHRDIKPQNIVLQFGVPKICDFGWATDCDDNHLCKSYCGTPLYLSPQMVKKQFYGTSVDIWAAGLVFYQLLVGRVPFSIWSDQDMDQIVNKSIQFPEYIDRSEKCEQFIRRCLEKQTFNRMEMSQALRHPFLNQNQSYGQGQGQRQGGGMEYQFYEQVNKILGGS